jgi:hypothetical protein
VRHFLHDTEAFLHVAIQRGVRLTRRDGDNHADSGPIPSFGV